MNHLEIDITCEGNDLLTQVMKIVFQAHDLNGQYRDGTKRGLTHYSIREPMAGERNSQDTAWLYNREPRRNRLLFFAHYQQESNDRKMKLPFTLDAEGAADFARRWLEEAVYPLEPDTDGDVNKGWRVYNEGGYQIESDMFAVIAIAPEWIVYGK